MKADVVKLLKEKNEKITRDQLLNKFKNVAPDIVLNTLKELGEENEVGVSITDQVYLIDNKKYFKGLLKLNPKGFGFVSDLKNPEHEDYFVPPVNLHNAISGDQVVYKLEVDDKKTVENEPVKYRAVIVDILERQNLFLVGEIITSPDGKFLDFLPHKQDFNSFRIIMVNKQDYKLKVNTILKVKILRSEGRKLFVRIIKIIGNALKAADRIISIAEEFNIKTEFNPITLKNAKLVAKLPSQEPEELKKRQAASIEDKLMVTIDGSDSKDLDDSILVEKIGTNYRLTVAIADVAHYVKPKSGLDNEALIRGNSTYLVNVVIPMLPEILSNGVCSLNPNEQKFCMVAEIDFDQQGKVLNKRVYESVMISKARLTYQEVNEFLNNGKELKHGQKVGEMLKVAHELHNILEKKREQLGTINFEIREPKIILDQNSNVKEISARTTGTGEKLIENFMVSANEAVAEIIFEKEYPFVYRNHGKPKEEDLLQWYSTLRMFGIDVKLTDQQKADPHNINKTLNVIDEKISDPIEKELLNLSLLRYMDKAKYGLENIGHFGLASKCYTHFTSPIRRYADLMVHRYLKEYLFAKQTSKQVLEDNEKFINKAVTIINDTEVNSVDTEREVNKVCMVEYMSDKVGRDYDGVIVVALKFGLFIQLENMVEGLVHITNLPTGTVYDEKAQTLTTPKNKVYRMGQRVKIKVIKSDLKTRKIDFQFVE